MTGVLKGVHGFFRILKALLVPSSYRGRVEDIELDQLYNEGYRTLIVDVENTLIASTSLKIGLNKITWLDDAINRKFKIILISNVFSNKRARRICKQLELPYLRFACKPFSFSLRALIKHDYIDFKKTVFIGDKIFTDVLLGNWLRGYTILVDPVGKTQSFFSTMWREFEFFWLRKLEDIS